VKGGGQGQVLIKFLKAGTGFGEGLCCLFWDVVFRQAKNEMSEIRGQRSEIENYTILFSLLVLVKNNPANCRALVWSRSKEGK